MFSSHEGIPIPEQQKTLIGPLLCTFLKFGDFVGADLESWFLEMQTYGNPLRKDLAESVGIEAYSREVHAAQSYFLEQSVIHSKTSPTSLVTLCDRLLLIGYETGSVRDVYAVSDRLISRFIQLNLINPTLLTVRGADDEKIEKAVIDPVVVGARLRQGQRKEDPLRAFRY